VGRAAALLASPASCGIIGRPSSLILTQLINKLEELDEHSAVRDEGFWRSRHERDLRFSSIRCVS
jgi:hypothetical protein